VYMVTVPGSEGDFGVLEGHMPTMTTIRDNAALDVYATAGAAPERITVTGGFAEVSDKGLTIFAERAA
jgi:F-type H+-transporting ATPase subunit epsilon